MSASSQKESWRSVGSLIEPFDKRNSDGCDYPFYGINKDKTFTVYNDFYPYLYNLNTLLIH